MEKIEPGKYFEIAYKLFRINPDGSETLVHEVTSDDPDRAIMGYTALWRLSKTSSTAAGRDISSTS